MIPQAQAFPPSELQAKDQPGRRPTNRNVNLRIRPIVSDSTIETVPEASAVAEFAAVQSVNEDGDTVQAATENSTSTYELVLEPGRAARQYWRDLWSYRELFYILAWRDVSVRYKQTAVGVTWALIQPLSTMIIMTVVFGRVAGLPSEGNAPYVSWSNEFCAASASR